MQRGVEGLGEGVRGVGVDEWIDACIEGRKEVLRDGRRQVDGWHQHVEWIDG